MVCLAAGPAELIACHVAAGAQQHALTLLAPVYNIITLQLTQTCTADAVMSK